MVDSIVQRHDSNIELIVAQALDTAIVIKLATPIVEQLNAYHALRPQPTLFNQRYSKEI